MFRAAFFPCPTATVTVRSAGTMSPPVENARVTGHHLCVDFDDGVNDFEAGDPFEEAQIHVLPEREHQRIRLDGFKFAGRLRGIRIRPGASFRPAASGKRAPKKDLAMMAITYGTVYVAHVALGASDTQTVKAFLEAEAYDSPALIIAYAHCIAHGIDMAHGLDQQKAAVQSAYWPLFRYNPEFAAGGKNAFQLDSRPRFRSKSTSTTKVATKYWCAVRPRPPRYCSPKPSTT